MLISIIQKKAFYIISHKKVYIAKLTLMKKTLQNTTFLTSATKLSQFPRDEGKEVAFVGRSNSGKSSLINKICRQNSLARVSKIPGRTQAINFFNITDNLRLVDLPGYGFARVPKKIKNQWGVLINSYLENRISLKSVVVVMDIRHPAKLMDQQLLEWCKHRNIPTHVILTKIDKLKKSDAKNKELQVTQDLAEMQLRSIQQFSAITGDGVSKLCKILENCLY